LTSVGITSQDAFIVKYNSSGTALWATNVGNIVGFGGYATGLGITTDVNGNVYNIGYFLNSTVINSFSTVQSGGVVVSSFGELNSPLPYNTYIAKYTSSGTAVWATNVGGSADIGNKITTDIYNNIYVIGTSVNSTLINSYSTVSGGDIVVSSFGKIINTAISNTYLAKYNSSGMAVWATNIGGTLNAGNDIALDTVGNIYITGYFNNLASINSYVAVETNIVSTLSIGQLSSIGSTDAYIAKYTSSGTAVWATNIGGVSIEYGFGVATDMSGNVYTTGLFNISTTVNSFSTISSNNIIVSSFGLLNGYVGENLYLAKYTSSGMAVWATYFGAISISQTNVSVGQSVSTDLFGNVYTTGYFLEKINVHSFSTISSGNIIVSTVGILNAFDMGYDTFIVKLNRDGHFITYN